MDKPDGSQSVGGQGTDKREERVAEGVSVRRGIAGKPGSIRISFQYRDKECRERLALIPTKQNITFAIRLRGEIMNAIGRGSFNYAEYAIRYFPKSKNPARFGFSVSGRTVNDLLDDYEAVTQKAVEASTWAGYNKTITRLRGWFGTVALRDLSPGMIEAKFLEADIVLKTARNIRSVFNMALRRAVATRELAANPLDQVDLDLVWPLERKESDWAPDPFSFDEMTAIFCACDFEEEADYWRVAFGTGMRPSEQIALQWARVDFGGQRLRVEEARVLGLNGTVVKDHAKTKAGNRWIPFTAGALEALQRQHVRTGAEGGTVFLDARYGAPWAGETALRKRFARICAAASVRYRNPYQTRHTFGSTMLAAGHKPLRVALWMGHEGPEMIYRHYGRWIEQGDDPKSRAALDAFFSHPSPTEAKVVAFPL